MLMDCRTYRGANIDSDNFLVIANITAKLRSNKRRENNNNSRGLRKYKPEELKEHDKRREYGNTLKTELNGIKVEGKDSSSDINEYWRMVREAIDTIAEEVIGLKSGVKKQVWFNQDCEIVTQEKIMHTNERCKEIVPGKQ